MFNLGKLSQFIKSKVGTDNPEKHTELLKVGFGKNSIVNREIKKVMQGQDIGIRPHRKGKGKR